MGFIKTNRKQLDLFGYSFDDFVPRDAKCRFIVDIVSKLDLSALYQRYSHQGNDAFDPAVMLSTWFYAYSDTVTSTRRLEERCQRDLHYIYVSGNLKPDHTSLSRFRKNHLDLLSGYFVQIIKIAIEGGMTDFKQIAIDGSKIQAASSPRQIKSSDKLAQYLSKIRKDIKEYMSQCDLLDENSVDPNNLQEIRRRIDNLKEQEEYILARQKELESRKSSLKSDHRKNHKINIAEPEARNMNRVNGKQKLPAYNVQVGVDTKTQLIVANETVQDTNDYGQLSRQHKNVESNLGPDQSRCYIYDAGYHNLDQLEYVYTGQLNVFVVSPRKNNDQVKSSEPRDPGMMQKDTFDRSNFVYDHDNDYFLCPAGNKLVYEKEYQKDNKWTGRVYKTTACPDCSMKTLCLTKNKNSKYRRIRREYREKYAEMMQKKGKTDQGKRLQKIRKSTVEPVFGNLKANLGFRRFRLRGHKQVSGEFNLMCIAHNLNKLFGMPTVWLKNPDLSIKSAVNSLKTSCQRTIIRYLEKFYFFLIPNSALA